MDVTKQQIKSTFKSQDTEEWLDVYFTRPIGFLWVRFFNHFDIHPNVVTILSIFLGVAAGVMFFFQDTLSNVIGVLLLMWANFYDSCDGQLARLTGKKTQWGRILDGFAGDVWFVSIYFFICLRLFHQNIPFTDVEWHFGIFALSAVAGIICHTSQCQLADYYRNIHLYFLPGADSELDTSERQTSVLHNTPRKGNFWWRAFLWGYRNYTRKQERLTPDFQKLMKTIRECRGGKVNLEFRNDFRERSLPLMKYANFLTFNCRAITLYICCLTNVPWLYFIVEITLFSIVAYYMRSRHERMCRDFSEALKEGKYPNY